MRAVQQDRCPRLDHRFRDLKREAQRRSARRSGSRRTPIIFMAWFHLSPFANSPF